MGKGKEESRLHRGRQTKGKGNGGGMINGTGSDICK